MWIIESFGSAFSESVYNADSHQIGGRWSLEAIAWWQRAVAASFIFACALVIRGGLPHAPPSRFWIPALISVGMNAGASLLYVRALREDLSLTVPITALSPVFLLATEPLISGRFIPMTGMLGVAIIGIGLYTLNLRSIRSLGPLGPIKSVWRHRGTRMMLIVVIIWAVTAPLDSMAVREWDPLWYAALLHGGICVILTPICWRKPQAIEPRSGDRWRLGSLGLLSGLGSMLQMTAMAVAPATVVIAMRRFAAPLSAVWGWLFFDEPHIRTRLLGALVMAIGAAVMLMSL